LGKVAAAGDEGQLVCAAVAAWIVSSVIGSSVVFCNAGMQIAWYWLHGCVRGAAKRSVMAASRFLAAAAVCVILLSFAAGSRES